MARPKLDRPSYRLIKRGDRYYVRWWQNGAYHRVSARTNDRREAERQLAQLAAGIDAKLPPPEPTIGRILDGYLKDKSGKALSFGTLVACAKALRRHLEDLQPQHITKQRSRFYAEQRRREGHFVGPPGAKRRKTTKDGTILRELLMLRAAIRWAIKEKWLPPDAEPHIEVPRAPPPRNRWLTREEAGRLIESAVRPHVSLYLRLALYTAARQRAILDLTWDRVDFNRGLIDLGNLPGGKGRAIVPIASPLLEPLIEAKTGSTCSHVIEFKCRPVASVKTGTRAAAIRANLPGVTPHILRHTAATWMTQTGTPLREVAQFLGNTEKLIERVYGHHMPDWLRGAAEALAGPLAPITKISK